MELTIDQALQQGLTAHKEGKLQDAERLYRTILQAQPNHPDANHNLGVLAVSVGRPLEAIPLFKLALEARPEIDQFWLSYTDALIKLERFDEAKRVLIEAEQYGIFSEKLDILHQRIQPSPPGDKKNTKQVLTLSEKRKKLAEKKKAKKKKVQAASSSVGPSQDQISLVLDHYQASRFSDAEELAASLTKEFPEHPFAWRVLGVLLEQTGRVNESLLPMQKSVELSPHEAEAHSNLGVTLQGLGRFKEAEASHRQALAIKPDYAKAHNNLGNTLKDLGRLEEAEASYRQAIALTPDYAEAHYNFGNTLRKLSKLEEAEASYRQAIALKPDFVKAHSSLGTTLKMLGRHSEGMREQKLWDGVISFHRKHGFTVL